MGDLNLWLSDSEPLQNWRLEIVDAHTVARRIDEKPTLITTTRVVEGVKATLVQTVRLDPLDSRPREADVRAGGQTAALRMLVSGYKNHPTIADTVLKRGDTFLAEDQMWEVIEILSAVGDQLQAICSVGTT